MATVVSKPETRKPVFTKVDQLKPRTNGHTLTVKVVISKTVLQKAAQIQFNSIRHALPNVLLEMKLVPSSSPL